MNKYYPLMIPESEFKAGDLIVKSPFSGETIASVAQSNFAHIEKIIRTADQLYQQRNEWLSTAKRIAILEKLVVLMQQESEALAMGAAAEGGKPLSDSRVEVTRAISGVKLCIEHINTQVGAAIPLHESSDEFRRIGFTQKEPIGVVVAVSAFNHPLNLIVHQVGAAIAAGCPTIVKPAQDTPLSCIRFVQLLHQAGLPKNWCQVILPESTALATELVTDSRVGLFSFIGSARVGWMLRSKLAPGTRCLLEHGGIAPVIVDASANLDELIPAITKGAFYHAGQVCVSVQRVYLPNNIIENVAKRLAKAAQGLIMGDPLDSATEVGPLIRSAEVDRIEQWVNEAVNEGAKLICGGKRIDNRSFQPTILLNPSSSSKVSSQEIFGPVVCLYGYEKLNEAITSANASDFSFQAAVFTKNIDKALVISQQLNASAVMVNDHTAFRDDGMPFAGLGKSGLGVGGIKYTIDEMQVDKMTMIKTSLNF